MVQKNKLYYRSLLIVLIVLTVLIALLSSRFGAVSISTSEIFSSLEKSIFGEELITLNERIFMTIRLPRVVLGILVGAGISVAGSALQALFRNPIVEPGLLGTSSGAAFGASVYFVLGATLSFETSDWGLPLSAGLGALFSTSLVLIFEGGQQRRTSVTHLLLIGIAINGIFLSGVGLMSYLARDPQARSIAFWNLGTLSGATWKSVTFIALVTGICFLFLTRYLKSLNLLGLGEEEAFYSGLNVKRLKFIILGISIIMVASSTAYVGVISFLGLVVPHISRLLVGADQRRLFPVNILIGAIFLTLADLLSRIIVQPAELPIGIVTSIVGAPVFIFLLKRSKLPV